jgi:hypothetical protein
MKLVAPKCSEPIVKLLNEFALNTIDEVVSLPKKGPQDVAGVQDFL